MAACSSKFNQKASIGFQKLLSSYVVFKNIITMTCRKDILEVNLTGTSIRFNLRVRFFKKIEDWILKSERI